MILLPLNDRRRTLRMYRAFNYILICIRNLNLSTNSNTLSNSYLKQIVPPPPTYTPQTPGGRLHTSLPRTCGLKLEGNGSFLDIQEDEWSTSIWVYCVRVYTYMAGFYRSYPHTGVFSEDLHPYIYMSP